MSPPSMRHLLFLSAALASLQGCTCQGTPSTAVDAGLAKGPPSAGPPPPVSERAKQLHEQGRKHGSAGEFELALRYFHEAQKAAPTWPMPAYDAGLTFIYLGANGRALESFQEVDKLAPEGISDSKQMLDSLRREQDGRVPVGTLREFIEVMRMKDLAEVRRRLEVLTLKAPAFVLAWKDLAVTSDKPEEAERLVDKALSLEPDVMTRGELLVYRALLVWRRGDPEAARKQLREILEDPTIPASSAARARELFNLPSNIVP